jgi:hypothetical protein
MYYSMSQCVDELCSLDACDLQDHADPCLSYCRGYQVKNRLT